MHVSILCEETNDPNTTIRLRATNYAFPFVPRIVYLEKLNVDVQALWRGVQFGPLERTQARRNS